jgi:hypothetical protein
MKVRRGSGIEILEPEILSGLDSIRLRKLAGPAHSFS